MRENTLLEKMNNRKNEPEIVGEKRSMGRFAAKMRKVYVAPVHLEVAAPVHRGPLLFPGVWVPPPGTPNRFSRNKNNPLPAPRNGSMHNTLKCSSNCYGLSYIISQLSPPTSFWFFRFSLFSCPLLPLIFPKLSHHVGHRRRCVENLQLHFIGDCSRVNRLSCCHH